MQRDDQAPVQETGPLIDDDLWQLFGSDNGPGPVWAFAEYLLVLAVPAMTILAAAVLDSLFPGDR